MNLISCWVRSLNRTSMKQGGGWHGTNIYIYIYRMTCLFFLLTYQTLFLSNHIYGRNQDMCAFTRSVAGLPYVTGAMEEDKHEYVTKEKTNWFLLLIWSEIFSPMSLRTSSKRNQCLLSCSEISVAIASNLKAHAIFHFRLPGDLGNFLLWSI